MSVSRPHPSNSSTDLAMASDKGQDSMQVVLQPMRHQDYIRREGEDWAGMTDRKERKRLQNRLNQRARESPGGRHSAFFQATNIVGWQDARGNWNKPRNKLLRSQYRIVKSSAS